MQQSLLTVLVTCYSRRSVLLLFSMLTLQKTQQLLIKMANCKRLNVHDYNYYYIAFKILA